MSKHDDNKVIFIEPLLVRVEEAERILGLGRTKIYELIRTGQIASVKAGTARRIPMAALKKWVEDQQKKAA